MTNMKLDELWVPIPGFDNAYSVSSRGRVESHTRRDSLGRIRLGCMMKTFRVKGVEYVTLTKDKKRARYATDELICAGFKVNDAMLIRRTSTTVYIDKAVNVIKQSKRNQSLKPTTVRTMTGRTTVRVGSFGH